MIRDLILKNRSYRRFYEKEMISLDKVRSWIDLARCSPSARNAQSLKYYIATDPEVNKQIYPCLKWAGYLTNWDGPEEGERPSAYVVMLNDVRITDNYFCDDGIAAQSILLGAVEDGFGGCIVASVNKKLLADILILQPYLDIIQVIALGKPKEKVVLEPMKDNSDFKYWRSDDQIHHVPKRDLDDIIISEG